MSKHTQILFIAMISLFAAGCSTSRPIVSPALFDDVKTAEPIKATMIRYDDPKIRKWRWLGTYPQRWDLVVFHDPSDRSRLFLARVIGLPGETLEIRAGKIRINDTELKLPMELATANYPRVLNRAGTIKQEIQDDHYYLLSDTGARQQDSREIGTVLVWDIIGRLKEPG